MHLAYYDETGDDGFPRFSSPLFTLSVLYLHYLTWQEAHDRIRCFRQSLRASIGLPVKWEMHSRAFLLNKKPYRGMGISERERVAAIDERCNLGGSLGCRIISVVIVKPRISSQHYQVLDTALKYSVQRIENDLDPERNPGAKFLIITDPGRVGKMRRTTRRIQRINYIPSRFGPYSYRKEIRGLVEDPIQKESSQSYFIQAADLVSYITYLYATTKALGAALGARLPAAVTPTKVLDWMEMLKPSLNLQASGKDPYGVVFHP
ncbi:MAG: hypothetical protein A2Y93_00435 [Chloroflexi bacterium RBG_13_68_17]|nr:MAG: hypothetical protein A2Y93_00435 [Chloroflexi bacterium RBG_13_68_17]